MKQLRMLLTGLGQLPAKILHFMRRYRYVRARIMLPSLPGGQAACGQDVFVAALLGNKRGGVFVDIGANDGVSISNSIHFEQALGWSGLAVEPLPEVYEKLLKSRHCQTLNACITPKAGTATFITLTGGTGSSDMLSTLSANYSGLTRRRLEKNAIRQGAQLGKITVQCLPFADAMTQAGIRDIDFLSVDTEGGELTILKNVDFSRYPTKVISVENNFFTNDIRSYLEAQGFIYMGTFKVDEIYMHRSLTTA